MRRPQPLGVFPGISGFLLLPDVSEADALLPRLVRGERLDRWPAPWRFFAAAIEGQRAEDVRALLPEGSVGRFNAFVLDPGDATFARARASASGDMVLLLDAIGWRMSLVESPPSPGDTDGEVRAFLLATHAYAAFEEGQWDRGLDVMAEAAAVAKDVSPIFAARLYAEWASTRQMLGDCGQETIDGYRTALALLEHAPFPEARAELWFQMGTACQTASQGRHDGLLRAVRCYHEALKGYDAVRFPEDYAMVHMNLALAYLAMPSHGRDGRLRTAIAIQSLREALRIFQKDTHPDMWASATVNLANALQHGESSHLEQNLWEAVALYEDVLQVRRAEDDPVGYARVLANQGNALAHLGAFSRAVPRLEEARRYFLAHGELSAADGVADVLAEIRLKMERSGMAPADAPASGPADAPASGAAAMPTSEPAHPPAHGATSAPANGVAAMGRADGGGIGPR